MEQVFLRSAPLDPLGGEHAAVRDENVQCPGGKRDVAQIHP